MEVVESPSLEVFKNHRVVALWVGGSGLGGGGVGLGGLHSVLQP